MKVANTISGMSFAVIFAVAVVVVELITIGDIITSVVKGAVSCPPHANLNSGANVDAAGLYWQDSRHVSGSPGFGGGMPGAHVGGFGRHLPEGAAAPPMHPASMPASAPCGSPSENSQYSPAAQSPDSAQLAPGVTHFWNEQT